MRPSRAMDLLRLLDPVDRDGLDDAVGSQEADGLLESILRSEPPPRRSRPGRRVAPRLVTAVVAAILLVPAGYGLWRSFGPALSDDPIGPAPTTEAPQPDPTGVAPTPPPDDRRYGANAIVLQKEGEPAMLCVGPVPLSLSLPPQCGDMPITNWSWRRVEGEETMAGVTWGDFHVLGTSDGTSFTVLQVGPRQPEPSDPEDAIEIPCPEPEGGWVAADPGRTADGDLRAALRHGARQPDSAGVWLKHLVIPPGEGPYGPDEIVLNAAFIGDLERHRRELGEIWGGPLCVVRYERTEAELRRIQDELFERGETEFGLVVLSSDVDIVDNRVELGVVIAPEETQAAIDARYGEGVVRLVPALMPVD
jgi:hypothetical protein